jgi:transcriptional regulator with XRE-family HTH domain
VAKRPGLLTIAVAQEVRERRKRAELDQEDVWEAAGLKRNTYLRIERGERTPDIEELDSIAEVFGTTQTALIQAAKRLIREGKVEPYNPAAAAFRRQLGFD